MDSILSRTLSQTQKIVSQRNKELEPIRSSELVAVPKGFINYNRMIGNPIHPGTGKPTDIFDFQDEYSTKWSKYHKIMLNKARKLGATETGVRKIGNLCLDGTYSNHRVMIVAGNKQSMANRFLERFLAQWHQKGFDDAKGKHWDYNDIVLEESSSKADLINNVHVEAYPATEAVRGEENVICVYMIECAFTDMIDDTKVYNALHPVIANIPDADFIMESTPNGKRGFFWTNWDASSEYHKLELPYTRALNKLLTPEFIEAEKKNPSIDFEQEYCCKFTTSSSSAFKESDINFVEKEINNYDNL